MISDKAIDNMIRGAKIYAKFNIEINEFPASDIHDALCELKQYRECELRRELDELSKAAAPLIELMQRKYNPHHKIIVTLDGVEVLLSEMGVPAAK